MKWLLFWTHEKRVLKSFVWEYEFPLQGHSNKITHFLSKEIKRDLEIFT